MGEKEVDQLPTTTTATVTDAAAAAAAAGSGNKYFHESIKNIKISINDDDQEEYEYDFMHMVDDPLEQTTVVIMITINRCIDDNRSTTKRSYDLKGFLKGAPPNELDDLLSDKTVTPRTLKKVKKALLKRRYGIKKVALKYLSFEKIIVSMKFDLSMSYSDHKEDLNVDDDDDDVEEEMLVDDDDDDDEDDDDDDEEEILDDDDDDDEEDDDDDDDEDEEMYGETFDEYDDDDDNVSWKPALRSSVETLETRIVKSKEDFEMMLKISSCGNKSSCRVCLEEFLFDAAAGGAITIKTMPCSHIFHSECINKWLEKKHTCPTCRWEMPTADH